VRVVFESTLRFRQANWLVDCNVKWALCKLCTWWEQVFKQLIGLLAEASIVVGKRR